MPKVQFAILVQQYPDDDELRYSLALVCLEGRRGTKPTTTCNSWWNVAAMSIPRT